MHVQDLNRLWCHRKNDIIFKTMAMDSQWWRHQLNTFFLILVNANTHAKFRAPMAFGLEVK